ncbi:hypothetical protein BH10BAC3_BH10BAC3_27550 [soil metagenome]
MNSQQELALRERNTVLEKALSAKNRELEIEASLERVRAVAMGMKQPADMLDVCRIISGQLQLLSIRNIRNIQTAIFYETSRIYLNYEYFCWHDKTVITQVEYDLQPDIKAFVNQMQQDPEAFFSTSFEGAKLEEWIAYQQKANQFVDTKLNEANALHYYFYSIGPGALGISTYAPLNDSEIGLFKRFRNVFQLAYRRFVDIQQAEAQVREAQIELALERVRARTMAMQHSDELPETAAVLFREFKKLGEDDLTQATIAVYHEAAGIMEFHSTNWAGGGEQISHPFNLSIEEPTVLKPVFTAWKAKKKSCVIDLTGEALDGWINFRNKHTGVTVKAEDTGGRRVIGAAFFSKGHLSIGSVKLFSSETISTLERFAGVFDGTYTRFLDLQKAEAQAREAQIELALERVRASTMAMQKSEELSETAYVLFQQFKELGENPHQITIGIIKEAEGFVEFNITGGDGSGAQINRLFKIDINEPALIQKLVKGWKENKKSSVIELAGNDLTDWVAHRNLVSGIIDNTDYSNSRRFVAAGFFTKGLISISTVDPFITETILLLERFAKIFEQTYTRFLDLQKAEAQAREAQIETALERVRSRSMGMQKSEELKEVIKIVYQQLSHLKINLDHSGFVVDYTPGGDWHFWIADEQVIPSKITHPYFESVWANQFNEAKEKGADFFATNLNFEEKNKFYNELLSYVPGLPETSKDFYLSRPGLAASTVLFNNVSLYIENFSGTPYTDEENNILMRFGKVFQQTYTRFLDLQKAEAQAREAKIEGALERVRARTMAMQSSDELAEASHLLERQVAALGIKTWGCAFHIFRERDSLEWHSNGNGVMPTFAIPREYVWLRYYEACKRGETFFINEYTNEECTALYEYMATMPVVGEELQKMKAAGISFPTYQVDHVASFKYGYLLFITFEQVPDVHDIFIRFAKVFEQTYTRFLDLQKAEAQAREAEIELALERVRAKTMAMQNPSEFIDVINTIGEQFFSLGFDISFANFSVNGLNISEGFDVWNFVIVPGVYKKTDHVFFPRIDHPIFQMASEALNEYFDYGKDFYTVSLGKSDKDSWLDHHYTNTIYKDTPPEIKALTYSYAGFISSNAFAKDTWLSIGKLDNNPFTDEQNAILKRFSNAFGQAFTRFLDLQKAEAQAREGQIEAALERVRSRTMAMQKSMELGETATLLFEQMNRLVPNLWSCGFVLCDRNKTVDEWWLSGGNGFMPDLVLPNTGDVTHENIYKAWVQGSSYHKEVVEGEALQKHYEWLITIPVAKAAFDAQAEAGIPRPVWQQLSCAYFTQGYLVVITEVPCHESDVFKRFANVFDQTYTRFLDLQKAEAQAREGHIQLAMERVRARTMAMQKSDELPEASNLLFHQVQSLGMPAWSAGYCIWDEDKQAITLWMSSEGVLQPSFKVPLTEDPSFIHMLEGSKKGESFFVEEIGGDALKRHYEYLRTIPGVRESLEEIEAAGFPVPTFQIFHLAYFSKGFLLFITYEPVPEAHEIFKRFANVFDQTYTRFLDLQKAEAQAREAEIELALERVRARTMAMQQSEELQDAASLMVQQIQTLGVPQFGSGFNIWDDDRKAATAWMCNVTTDNLPPPFKTSSFEDIFLLIHDAAQRGESLFVREQAGEELKTHYGYMNSIPIFKEYVERASSEGLSIPDFQIMHCAFFSQGYLMFITYEPVPEAHDIFKRFAKVFEQTYTRFLDLQKAEAQARESQIQLALERVRARTMAMQHSDELTDAANLLFQQVQSLQIPAWSCGFNIWEKDEKICTGWMSTEGFLQPPFKIPLTEHPTFIHFYQSRQKGESFYSEKVEDAALADHYNYMLSLPDFAEIAAKHFKAGYSLPTVQTNNVANFLQGNLIFITSEDVPEAHDIFKRFAKVFEQTYTRFLDLQKAEAQAREAQIENALERVRSRSLAMHKSDELMEVVQNVFERLNDLNIDFYTAIIVIFTEGSRDCVWWLVSKINKQPSILIKYADVPYLRDLFEAKEKGNGFLSACYSGEDKKAFYDHLLEHTDFKHIPEEQKQLLSGKEFATMYVALIKNIGIHITRYTDKLFSEKEQEIIIRFSRVFNQAYTRFLDLQKAETQAREAQIEAALEKVRNRTMAMHKSDELIEVIASVFQQLEHLSFRVDSANLFLNYKENPFKFWMAVPGYLYPSEIDVPYADFALMNLFIREIKSNATLVTAKFNQEEKNEWVRHLIQHSIVGNASDEKKKNMFEAPGLAMSVAGVKNIALAITNYSMQSYSDEENQILRRFVIVFDQTYTRFLDLQKAEAQAREALIEAALERVRSRTTGMQKSEELRDVIQMVFEQLRHLDFNIDSAHFNLNYKESDDYHLWSAAPGQPYPVKTYIPYFDHPVFITARQAKENGLDFFTESYSQDEKNKFFEHLFKHVPAIPEERRKYILSGQGVAASTVLMNTISLWIMNYAGTPYSQAENAILKRFGKIFEQSHIRFLDLQKAEAQAKEAQIELGLEKVRSRSLAMHKSDELMEVVTTVFERLGELEIEMDSTGIFTFTEGTKDFVSWIATSNHMYATPFHVPYFDSALSREIMGARDHGMDLLVKTCTVEEKNEFWSAAFEHSDFKNMPDDRKKFILEAKGYSISIAHTKNAWIMLSRYYEKPFSEAENGKLKRFARVFEQAYTRFLDLQKAEEQAREAQIEAALETVRAAAMSMMKSEEFPTVCESIYKQLVHLGFEDIRSAQIYVLDDSASTLLNYEYSDVLLGKIFKIKYGTHPLIDEFIRDVKKGNQDLITRTITGDAMDDWRNNLYNTLGQEHEPLPDKAEALSYYHYSIGDGTLGITTFKHLPDDQLLIFKRLRNVFSLSYKRYKDISLAEAQTREAKIEAALERVRAQTMAMHNSEDVTSATETMFDELKKLGIDNLRCGIANIHYNRTFDVFGVTNLAGGNKMSGFGLFGIDEHPIWQRWFENWKNKEEVFIAHIAGQEKEEYFGNINNHNNYLPQQLINLPDNFFQAYYFEQGSVWAYSLLQHSEPEKDIMKRFASGFSLTFRRYQDLKKAEAQTREAIKASSLDRVRGEIASMRNAEDLHRITPLVWKELTALSVPFFRCGVMIVEEKEEMVQLYLSTPEGKPLAALHLPFNSVDITRNGVSHWRLQKVYTDHWDKEQFIAFTKSMIELGQIQTANTYQGGEEPPESITLQFVPFTQGMMYVGSAEPLSNSQIDLVQALADAFSVAYARYEDFTKLEAAKQQVENTLTELKATQKQLIQSEKMASLGELTAGIAHEIKNPLNFINNFSEVNTELIEELREELLAGNTAEAVEIANDIKTNEEKINHHGKRADAIVKSMLQHSRSSSGIKEPTDINVLADEYLRLAYHGLRAKDNLFNATLKTDYDNSIGNINITPQDIGRVILNLITNAFYAVDEKRKLNIDGYNPTISINTKKINDTIEISVTDNGNGIPQKVLDKIFQPFFTTKPTGEGTGLGLSLSYDIIKAHGGDIKVETKEGEGSEFTIALPES